MDNKIIVNLILRKPFKDHNHSIERIFGSFQNLKKKNLQIKTLLLPYKSKGIFRRFLNILYIFLKQGEINHVSGDINYVSILIKKKLINTFNDTYILENSSGLKRKILFYFWFYLPIKFSNKKIFISHFSKKRTIFYFKYFKKNYSDLLKNSIVINPPLVIKKKYKKKKFNSKRPNILFIGTTKNKNLYIALKAIKDLKCIFTIVGKLNNKEKEKLYEYKINFNNKINVSNSELHNLYVNSDIVLFPSSFEGFGMPIIEANYYKKPIITSNHEPMNKVAGKSAILVNPNNHKDIRKKILKTINNKLYRETKIRLGSNNINKYEYNNFCIKYLNIYSKLNEK